MKPPALKTYEKSQKELILVVDKIGVIGEELAKQFSKDYLVVLVSSNRPSEENEEIIHFPFKRKIPQVPDNRYSKIFIVDDGRAITRESAFSFMAKARESNSPLFFIGSIRNVDVAHADEISTSYANSKVLIFGDLFDKNIFFDKDVVINRYILQARKTKKIEVEGNGLSLSFPISFSDTIKLIIKSSHLDIPQKIILLFCQHPITDISLANIFQKINPDITVDFIKEEKERKIYIPIGAQHAINKYDLTEKIRELDLEDFEDRQLQIVDKDKNERKSFLKPVLFFFLVCLFILLLPLMTTFSYLLLGQREMSKAVISVEKGELEKAQKHAYNSKTFFETALKTSLPLSMEARFLGRGKEADKIKNKIRSGEMISQAGIYTLEAVELIRDIYLGKSIDPNADFSKASNSLKSAVGLLQKSKAERALPGELDQKLDNMESFIDLFSNSSDILPEILGFEKEKIYLVLFQNNMRLRPGGGIIESYAILKIKNAKVVEFNVHDSAQIDENLKAYVESPFGLRRYLPSPGLYLKDSNFNPDFVNNAVSASNIYSLATNSKVDGVIGMDFSFAKEIISALGEVSVSGYKKTINKDNLYEIAQSEDFLGILVKAIMQDLAKRKDKPYFLLAENVGRSIKEKHLIFAFPELTYQNIFTANGWSSSLWDNRQKDDNRINDYFGISEANLGKNNINRFISRSVSKKLVVSEQGNVSSKLTIGYKNNSSSKDKAVDYKNYLQLILPEGAIIKAIAIDNKQVEIEKAITNPAIYGAKNFKPPQGFEVDERNQSDKTIFGFLLIVPSSQVRTLSIVYDLPYTLPPVKKSIIYSLKLYKQPGIDSYPFDLTFELPRKYQALGGNSVSEEINSDKEISLTIAQK